MAARGRPALDDPDLRAWRDGTLYRLLLRAHRAEAAATLERLHAAGFTDVSLKDTNLLANLDTEGTIISALARRAGVTRQAASQHVATLERVGYVERSASDLDGRAAVIRQSDRGRSLLATALDIVADLERDYERILGRARFAELQGLLSALVEHIDPQGVLGRE